MGESIRAQIREKVATLAAAAFGLVAALAWNDTVRAFFSTFLAQPDNPWALLTYAITVTIVAVLATILIGRFAGPKKQ